MKSEHVRLFDQNPMDSLVTVFKDLVQKQQLKTNSLPEQRVPSVKLNCA
jgi:hypothetical protein